jgi:hypothetical protein
MALQRSEMADTLNMGLFGNGQKGLTTCPTEVSEHVERDQHRKEKMAELLRPALV